MKRPPRLPMAAALLSIWLFLNDSVAFAQIMLGMALTGVVLLVFRDFLPAEPSLRRPVTVLRLAARVVFDIVQANLSVARAVLRPTGPRLVRSAFVRIPLELRDSHGLAVLAGIVTSTPGTVWAGLTLDGTLTLHVLDVQDETAVIRTIKECYERPLMEIFE
jgi:multicomponent K+:H+ antiporter subunit E